MKALRRSVLANALLLVAVGGTIAFSPPLSLPVRYAVGEPYQSLALIHVVAIALEGSALALLLQAVYSFPGEVRRIAFGLALANGLIALMFLFEQVAFDGNWVGWLLMLIALAMAAALVWLARRPLSSEEVAAEMATLQIPDEIRQALLRQIGEAAAQEERNRLARDLHDSIKQQLFSINVGSAAVQERWERDPDGARKALADVRRSAREAMVEMQAMLHQLRPEPLGSAGLVEALREQCEALGYRTGAEVTLELGDPIPEDRMPPGAPEALFRMAQEMLANVARHARARRVRLWLGRQEEAAILRVEDDGQGFDPAAAVPGMGLRNLKERAEALRGHLAVASSPGAGSRIQVQVPLLLPAIQLKARSLRGASWALTITTWMTLGTVLVLLPDPDDALSAPSRFLRHLLVAALIVGLNVLMSWLGVWSARRQFPDAGIADVAYLRYSGHRGRALLLLIGAAALYQGSHLRSRWGELSFLLSLLCLALMSIDVYGAHRWSRPHRRPFEGWAWPSKWEFPPHIRRAGFRWLLLLEAALMLAGVLLNAGFWTDPAQRPFIALGAALLLYFFWRRPLTEGTVP